MLATVCDAVPTLNPYWTPENTNCSSNGLSLLDQPRLRKDMYIMGRFIIIIR